MPIHLITVRITNVNENKNCLIFYFRITMSFNKGGDGKPRGFGFGGFQMSKREQRSAAIPPPPTSNVSKHGYSTMSAITQNALVASGWGGPKKRAKTEDE